MNLINLFKIIFSCESTPKIYLVLLLNLVFFFALGNTKASARENILVLHSYHADFSWTEDLKQGINEEFARSEQELNVFHEFIDAKRNPNLEYTPQFLKYIQQKYQNYPPDIILVSDDPGLDLVLQYREEYYSGIPIVFLGINHVSQKLLKTPNMTGVFENRDLVDTVNEASRQTNSETVVIINDTTQTGKANLDKIEREIANKRLTQKLIIINDLSPSNIEEEFGNISSEIPVILFGQLRYGYKNQALMNFKSGIQTLRSKTNNPIYGLNTEMLDLGIVGGKFLDGKVHAQEAAELAIKIIDGIPIEEVKPIIKAKNTWIFDARQLDFYNIETNSLPPDSELINLQVSFCDRHRSLVWITIIAFTITIGIIILLVEIIRRRSITEKIIRENETRYRDLAEAGANIFWEMDTQGRFSYISGDTNNLFYKQPSEIIGRTLTELYRDGIDLDFAWETYDRIVDSHQDFNNFIFRIERDKEIKLFQLNGKPIYNSQGEFIGYRGIKREITQEYNLSQTIAYQASYDHLTGLINRREFHNHLNTLVEKTKNSQISSVF